MLFATRSLQSGSNVRWADPAAVLDWMKTLAAPVSIGGTDPIARHPLLAGLRHVYAGAAEVTPPLMGEKATVPAFLRLASDNTIIHLAAHGVANPEVPS